MKNSIHLHSSNRGYKTTMQTSKRFYGMKGLFLLWMILGSVHPVYGQPAELPIIASRHLFDITASFLHPSDVTVGSQGRIYVLDGVNNTVKIFNASGKYLSSFGSRGKGGGKCDTPLGIDSDRDGSIYLADSGNRLIQVFDASGSFRFQFPVDVQDSLRPPDPVDVVIDGLKTAYMSLTMIITGYSFIPRMAPVWWSSGGRR